MLVPFVMFSHGTSREHSSIYQFLRIGDWNAVGKAQWAANVIIIQVTNLLMPEDEQLGSQWRRGRCRCVRRRLLGLRSDPCRAGDSIGLVNRSFPRFSINSN